MNIESLPIGRYADGSPVLISLSSRNCLMNGNPRSGKSVCLASLICSLLYCPYERVYILSPKILDFQAFAGAARLCKEADEMERVLEDVRMEAERRKVYCEEHRLKKISDFSFEMPHITVIVDEYTVIRKKTATDDKGKVVKVGERIEASIMKLIAETGFAGVSFVISTQRASSQNMSTDTRDIISGNRISFATSSIETNKMIFGDMAEFAPCHEITRGQVGVGYISVDDGLPRPFKGALTTETDELGAVQDWRSRWMS